ncbi:MAG: BrnT family toxin [Wenzhouxiangella sp.]
MIDWQRITGFQWDAGNARKSSDKHGVGQAEAESVFFNQPLLVLQDTGHSQQEVRLHALGQTYNQRLLHLTFTLRQDQTLIRVISARPMHRKERDVYAKAQQGSTEIQDRS